MEGPGDRPPVGQAASVLLVLAILSLIFLAMARKACAEKVEVHYMPVGTALTVGGEEVRYFKFDEYKLLLKMDQDLWYFTAQLDLYRKLSADLSDMSNLKDLFLQSKQREAEIYQVRSDRLYESWTKCEEALTDNSFDFSSFMYGIGGGVVIGVVVSAALVLATR
jgi:hypothetical protein